MTKFTFSEYKTCSRVLDSAVFESDTPVSNGNRIEWSPIRSVIRRVINKIRRPRSVSLNCLITSMITDRIGRHEVAVPFKPSFDDNLLRRML